jgi:hypothetical protein
MLLLAFILALWAASALFAVVLCGAARRGDRALAMVRPAPMDGDAARGRRFDRAS